MVSGAKTKPGRNILKANYLQEQASVEAWRDLHLETLEMIKKGDYMGMKLTGAGSAVTQRLINGQDPQEPLLDALDTILLAAEKQGVRIWIDAEPQAIQPTIDRWVLSLMRKYNRHGLPVVSNTYQAYLKSTPATLRHHINVAQREGWVLGIKLVRGAYIGSDPRHLIQDTKQQTDASYDSLAIGVIDRSLPEFVHHGPDVHIFIAGHNTTSIEKTTAAYTARIQSGRPLSLARWGQLQGMADEVSCALLQQNIDRSVQRGHQSSRALEVYQCLQWGTVGECRDFLLRRATENRGAANRMVSSLPSMQAELARRLISWRGSK